MLLSAVYCCQERMLLKYRRKLPAEKETSVELKRYAIPKIHIVIGTVVIVYSFLRLLELVTVLVQVTSILTRVEPTVLETNKTRSIQGYDSWVIQEMSLLRNFNLRTC